MRLLTLDIETSPNLAHVWGLWQQNVGLSQLLESTQMISFAAKWYDSKTVQFYSDYHHGHDEMVAAAWKLLDEADVIVHFNGRRFDERHLNREFFEAGLTPPSPYDRIDLLNVVKKRFLFPSNKLAYVTKVAGQEGKVQHEGHTLWIRCMAGDPKAWAMMKKYNKQDVTETEDLYVKLLPWIPSHPHRGLYGPLSDAQCPSCAGTSLVKEGLARTKLASFQRYHCADCGTWFRGGKAVERVDVRSAQL